MKGHVKAKDAKDESQVFDTPNIFQNEVHDEMFNEHFKSEIESQQSEKLNSILKNVINVQEKLCHLTSQSSQFKELMEKKQKLQKEKLVLEEIKEVNEDGPETVIREKAPQKKQVSEN